MEGTLEGEGGSRIAIRRIALSLSLLCIKWLALKIISAVRVAEGHLSPYSFDKALEHRD